MCARAVSVLIGRSTVCAVLVNQFFFCFILLLNALLCVEILYRRLCDEFLFGDISEIKGRIHAGT